MKKLIITTLAALAFANTAGAATFVLNNTTGNGSGTDSRTVDGITVDFSAPNFGQTASYANATFAANRGVGVRTGSNILQDEIRIGETLRVSFDSAVTIDSLLFSQWDNNDDLTITASTGSSLSYNLNVGGSQELVDISSLGSFQYIDISGNGGSSALHTISNVSAVPVPAAAWLFGSALTGLVGVSRRKQPQV
jgi:hypothetical protein